MVGPTLFAETLPRAGWKDVASLPWVAAPERSHVARFLRILFDQHGVRSDEIVECDQLSAMLDLIRSGLGLGLLREDIALGAVERARSSPGRMDGSKAKLSLIYRLSAEHDPAIVGMLSVLREQWGV